MRSDHSRSTGVGPLERLGGAVEGADKREDPLTELRHRPKTAAFAHPPHQNAAPDRDVIAPRGMLRHKHTLNPVRRVAQEGSAPGHRRQAARRPLAAEIVGAAAVGRSQLNQPFRLMRSALIRHACPHGIQIRGDRLGTMRHNVSFGARRAKRGGAARPGHHSKVHHPREGAMAFVCNRAPFRAAGLDAVGRRDPLQRLDAGHRVGTHAMTTQRRQQRRIGGARTDGFNLGCACHRIGLLGIQPIAAQLGLAIGLLLKTVRAVALYVPAIVSHAETW